MALSGLEELVPQDEPITMRLIDRFSQAATSRCVFAFILLSIAVNCPAATIHVDAGRKIGEIRPIHGTNGGPVCYGGVVDLSKYHRTLGVPMTRIHDANWPARDVVDIHAVFPDFLADSRSPASYRFAPTDDYLKAILATGSQVMYRLGESIEHTPRKYYVHKPVDYDRWAAICLGVIRHYNEGWGDGFRHNLRYFEIWNEAEIGPAQWDGSAEDYYRLYAVAARAIKARFPKVMVGGPAAAGLGRLDGDRLTPCPYLRGFLEYCRKESLPLDFLSWHMYTSDPTAPVRGTIGLRRVLAEFGFKNAEIHLDEWNYLPNNDWGPMFSHNGRRLQKWFEDAGSARRGLRRLRALGSARRPAGHGLLLHRRHRCLGAVQPVRRAEKDVLRIPGLQNACRSSPATDGLRWKAGRNRSPCRPFPRWPRVDRGDQQLP